MNGYIDVCIEVGDRSAGVRVLARSNLRLHPVSYGDAAAWTPHLRAAPSRT
jgi:hypothetical protein